MSELTLPSRVQELLEGEERWWIHKQVDDLERRVCALRERGMRRTMVLEALSTLDDAELVALLAVLLARAQSGRGPSREVMQEMALEPVIFTEISYERLRDAYTLARQERLDHVASFFLGNPIRFKPTARETFTENEHLEMPLGVRRAAARSTDRFVLDRLLHDRNHRVIALLLNNPRIIERDVIKIAAARPTRPEVLEQVARHRKWSSRYRVRKTLACNPYTPAPIARRLLPTLMRQDLSMIYTSKELPEPRRALASMLIKTQFQGASPREGAEAPLDVEPPFIDEI